MNKMKCLYLALAVICSFMQMSQSHATIITSGCTDTNNSCTLQELIDGGEINVDDVQFNNWIALTNALNTDYIGGRDVDSPLDLTRIFVAGIDAVSTGNPGEYTLGLKFSSEVGLSIIDVLEGELELDVDYDVTASNGATISAVQLKLGSRSLNSPDSFVEVNLDAITAGVNLQVSDEIVGPNTGTVLSDSQTLAVAMTAFQLTSNIQTGTFTTGGVELYDFSVELTVQSNNTQPPPPIPASAPASFSLLFMGFAMLFWQRRKLTVKQR